MPDPLAFILSEDFLIRTELNIVLAWSVFITLSSGQLSLGHAAFMAIGAYTASVLTVEFDYPLALALVGGALLAGFFGLFVGFPALRLRGLYLAVATLGMGEMVRLFFRNFEYTGGATGLRGMEGTSLFNVTAALVLCLLFVWKLTHSRLGLSLSAVSDDEMAASTLGINATYVKVLSFALGGMMAAAGGGLMAHYQFYIEPDLFGFQESILLVLFVVIGGMDNIWGPALGAILLTLLPDLMRGFDEWRMAAYGIILVAMVTLRPQGILTRCTLAYAQHP